MFLQDTVAAGGVLPPVGGRWISTIRVEGVFDGDHDVFLFRLFTTILLLLLLLYDVHIKYIYIYRRTLWRVRRASLVFRDRVTETRF